MNLTAYLLEHHTAATAAVYEREIVIYTGHCPDAESAVYKDILNYIGALRSRYSNPRTLSRIVSSIKAYYGYLCDAGIRTDNPAREIRLRDKISRDIQLQDLFSEGELEMLLNRAERFNNLFYRNKVLMGLLIYQALYPQEIAALTVGDINLEAGTVHIKPTAKASGRELSLQPNQVLLFYQYVQEIRPRLLKGGSTDKLLIGQRGGPMPAADITKHVIRSCNELYPGRAVNAQTIRQSVIANLLKRGHSLNGVQGFAGHKTPSTTERYRQNEIETLRAAIEQYHPMK